jgi:hypothetical protein
MMTGECWAAIRTTPGSARPQDVAIWTVGHVKPSRRPSRAPIARLFGHSGGSPTFAGKCRPLSLPATACVRSEPLEPSTPIERRGPIAGHWPRRHATRLHLPSQSLFWSKGGEGHIASVVSFVPQRRRFTRCAAIFGPFVQILHASVDSPYFVQYCRPITLILQRQECGAPQHKMRRSPKYAGARNTQAHKQIRL